MTVTILIPTANRPDFLKTALGSVARQSALDKTTRVIVSENGGHRASEAVCQQFPQLRIDYVFRDPPLDPREHGYQLFTRDYRTTHVALLCDDDWWSADHLCSALHALAQPPQAVAYFAASLTVPSEAAAMAQIAIPVSMRCAAGYPPASELWRLNPHQLVSAAWVQTPFHYSSMVVEATAVARAVEESRYAPGWYNDRLLFAALAQFGEVLFDPLASAYVRTHSGSDTARMSRRSRKILLLEGEQKVWDVGKRLGVDVLGFWREALKSIPPAFHGPLFDIFNYSFGFQRLRGYGLHTAFFQTALAWHWYRVIRKLQRTFGNG